MTEKNGHSHRGRMLLSPHGFVEPERRDPNQPHPWLDARVRLEPGQRVVASVRAEKPFRCSGIAAPHVVEHVAAALLWSVRCNGVEQLAREPDDPPVPLVAICATLSHGAGFLVLPSVGPGELVELELELERGAEARDLEIRFLGQWLP